MTHDDRQTETPAPPATRLALVTSGGTVDEIAEAARLAEEAGLDSVWASDFHDRSATVALAAMALRTSTIELGSGIAYAFGRTPLVLAAEARDLDELSGGRLILGLGTGTRRMQQDWHGLDGEHPASRMEELVPLLRRLWRLDEGPVEHEGRFYRLRVRPTAPVRAALRPEIPVYMAGVNPRMIEAAGAVADGLVGHPLFTADYVRQVARPALARGAARAGRSDSIPIAGFVNCCVDEDGEAARRDAAAMIAFNSTVKTYDAIHRLHGWEQEVDAIRRSWRAGDWGGMVDAVPRAMVESIAVAGTAQEARDQLRAREGLYERTLLWPPGFRGLEGVRAVLGAFTAPA